MDICFEIGGEIPIQLKSRPANINMILVQYFNAKKVIFFIFTRLILFLFFKFNLMSSLFRIQDVLI